MRARRKFGWATVGLLSVGAWLLGLLLDRPGQHERGEEPEPEPRPDGLEWLRDPDLTVGAEVRLRIQERQRSLRVAVAYAVTIGVAVVGVAAQIAALVGQLPVLPAGFGPRTPEGDTDVLVLNYRLPETFARVYEGIFTPARDPFTTIGALAAVVVTIALANTRLSWPTGPQAAAGVDGQQFATSLGTRRVLRAAAGVMATLCGSLTVCGGAHLALTGSLIDVPVVASLIVLLALSANFLTFRTSEDDLQRWDRVKLVHRFDSRYLALAMQPEPSMRPRAIAVTGVVVAGFAVESGLIDGASESLKDFVASAFAVVFVSSLPLIVVVGVLWWIRWIGRLTVPFDSFQSAFFTAALSVCVIYILVLSVNSILNPDPGNPQSHVLEVFMLVAVAIGARAAFRTGRIEASQRWLQDIRVASVTRRA